MRLERIEADVADLLADRRGPVQPRPRMRALKLVGFVLGGLIAVLILGAIGLVIFIDPNDYRSDIERLAKQKTGRDLTIGGKIGLKLFPWLALDIEDVSLGNPPGYGKEPFVTVKSASVGVKLLPLLRNRVEVRKVLFDGLTARLISRSDADNNWKDLGQSSTTSGGQSTGIVSTTIAGVDVTHSLLSYSDEAKHSLQRLTSLEVHLGEVGGATAVNTKVAFDYETEKGPVAHVDLTAMLKIPAASGPIEAQDLRLEALLHGAAKAIPVTLSIPSLALDPHAETLAPTTIDLTYDGIPAHLTASGEQLFGSRVVSGTFAVPDIRAVPKPLAHASASASFRLGKNDLHLTNVDVRFDDTDVTGTAGIDDLDRMALSFDLVADRVDVDHYLGRDEGGASGRNAKPATKAKSPPVDLPIEFLRGLNAKGVLSIGSTRISGVQLTEVVLPLDANAGAVRLAPTKAKLYGGTYNGNIGLDVRPAAAQLSLDEHLHAVDMGAFAKALFDSSRIVGRADVDAKLTSAGNTDTALIAGLTGPVKMNVRDGAFNGVDLWYEIRRARALLSQQAPPARTGPEQTDFKALGASAMLDHGLARNDDLKVDMDYLKVAGKGTVNLTSKAIDYRLTTQIYKLPAEGAGSELKDLKATEIPVTLSGTLDDIKIRPDLGGILKSRVKEEVKKKLGDKLRDLLGH